jgi:hypothetical protein
VVLSCMFDPLHRVTFQGCVRESWESEACGHYYMARAVGVK